MAPWHPGKDTTVAPGNGHRSLLLWQWTMALPLEWSFPCFCNLEELDLLMPVSAERILDCPVLCFNVILTHIPGWVPVMHQLALLLERSGEWVSNILYFDRRPCVIRRRFLKCSKGTQILNCLRIINVHIAANYLFPFIIAHLFQLQFFFFFWEKNIWMWYNWPTINVETDSEND